MLFTRFPLLVAVNGHRSLSLAQRLMGDEKRIATLLQKRFPNATTVDVHDMSGGCGSMYRVAVECNEFKGLPKVKQHRMVTDALKKEIASMHGIVIETSTPRS